MGKGSLGLCFIARISISSSFCELLEFHISVLENCILQKSEMLNIALRSLIWMKNCWYPHYNSIMVILCLC